MLHNIDNAWHFTDEAALETFVWGNLTTLLALSPLARQYSIQSEICDILAVQDRQLYILELKNTADRYLVQQLTRYYDRLLQEKPFSDDVDYQQPIKLLALAPSFHEHNFIDRKYLKLEIQFLRFELKQKEQEFLLLLKDLDTKQRISHSFLFDLTTSSSKVQENKRLTNLLKLHYWLSTKYAHKLGSELITDPDYRKYGWSRTPTVQNGRILKVELISSSLQRKNAKSATIRIPKSIPLWMILCWLEDNAPDVKSVKAESGRGIWNWFKPRSPKLWTYERIEEIAHYSQDDIQNRYNIHRNRSVSRSEFLLKRYS